MKKYANILPINNETVMEECIQYEPKYINKTKLYISPINNIVRNYSNILLISLIPVIGFTLSTLSLKYIRKIWEKNIK